jgi:hypothetical protein
MVGENYSDHSTRSRLDGLDPRAADACRTWTGPGRYQGRRSRYPSAVESRKLTVGKPSLAGPDSACRGERPALRLLYSYMPRETAVEKCA